MSDLLWTFTVNGHEVTGKLVTRLRKVYLCVETPTAQHECTTLSEAERVVGKIVLDILNSPLDYFHNEG